MPKKPFFKGNKKVLNAWAFYDWANSVYNLVISSAIFPIYYGALFRLAKIETISVLGIEMPRAALISYITAAAFVLIAIATPIASGIADYLGNKKIFLKASCYLGAISCIALYWFDLEHIEWGLLFYFLGLVGFWTSYAISNSYLPDIAYEEQMDRLSAKGFSMGYVGSVLLLIVNLVMVMKPEWFQIQAQGNIPAAVMGMKYSFITVGLWWLLFSQYSFHHLPKGFKKPGKPQNLFFNGFNEIRKVWRDMQNRPQLRGFLFAFFIYNMGVQCIMIIAAFFGEEEINWGSDEYRQSGLIISILIIQLIAIAGAYITAWCSGKYGNFKTLIFLNIVWVGVCVYAYFLKSPIDFYIAAFIVGLVMGGIQALSRSTYSKLLPDMKETTSYFSFFDVTEKISIVIGMMVIGGLTQYSGGMRISTLFFALLFALGILLIKRIKKVS